MAATTEPPTPERVRVVCFDPNGAVLLMKWRDPVDGHTFWEPPGGGIEPGETSREAAIRELYEETGLELELGRSVMVDRDYRWAGRAHRHVEEFFLAGDVATEARLAMPTEEELTTFLEWRFVAVDELDRLDAPLQPPELGTALARLGDGR